MTTLIRRRVAIAFEPHVDQAGPGSGSSRRRNRGGAILVARLLKAATVNDTAAEALQWLTQNPA